MPLPSSVIAELDHVTGVRDRILLEALDLLADLGETASPAERTLPLLDFLLATPIA